MYSIYHFFTNLIDHKSLFLGTKSLSRFPFDTDMIASQISNAALRITSLVEAEVKPEANILDSDRYSEIRDNTLNLLLPYESAAEKQSIISRFDTLVRPVSNAGVLSIKNPLNGDFILFQIALI